MGSHDTLMQELNQYFFLIINASENTSQIWLLIGMICAKYLVYLAPLVLIFGWFSQDKDCRILLLGAFLSALIAIFINYFIGLAYFSPRPFVLELGTNFLPHKNTSSFPSNHLSIFLAIALFLNNSKLTKKIASILIFIAIFIAWGRIYMGVHYPLDMLASIFVAYISQKISYNIALRTLIFYKIYDILLPIYNKLFGFLIGKWIFK